MMSTSGRSGVLIGNNNNNNNNNRKRKRNNGNKKNKKKGDPEVKKLVVGVAPEAPAV
jgi:hypothetical protein